MSHTRTCEDGHDFDPFYRCRQCGRTKAQVLRGELAHHHDPGKTNEIHELHRTILAQAQRQR